ncbi:hypothetical protein TNCV_4168211 [Trichonephila clavipes]|nr:hypothetical protein TNCV_4168211 [Trichonephila clavipes]
MVEEEEGRSGHPSSYWNENNIAPSGFHLFPALKVALLGRSIQKNAKALCKIPWRLRWPSGQGIGSWQACHEFVLSTTKDPPCREAMHVKSLNVLPLVWCGS